MLKSMQEMLEFAYDVINQEFFNNELPQAVVTLMDTKGAYGHFTIDKVWRADGTRYNEINISASYLKRPIENIVATLVHEMTHFYCLINGINDVSKGGYYHNKRFKQEAEKRGLSISYAKYVGYSVTEPGQPLIDLIERYGIEKPIDINRDGATQTTIIGIGRNGGVDGGNGLTGIDIATPKRKKTSTRKYVCRGCGCSFRATKDLRVMCLDCMSEYVRADGAEIGNSD